MRRISKLLLFFLPNLLFSQFDFSVGYGEGYFNTGDFGELSIEGRYSIKLKEKSLYLTPSAVFIWDGINYQTFPRVGFTKYQYNKNKNWNKWTVGIQAYDLEIPGPQQGRETTSIFSDESWKLRPFIKFNTPIFKLFKDCNCGAQSNKLLTELFLDLTPSTFNIGLGIRKRI